MNTIPESIGAQPKPGIVGSRMSMGVDGFRLAFALVAVGAHTYPLAVIDENLNYFVFHVLARIIVPFFLMTTGYFLLPRYIGKAGTDPKPLIKFIKKTAVLYAIATILYLPISIYAGHYSIGSLVPDILKRIVFDGTFYHLWYLPASIIGVLIVYLLGRKFSPRTVLAFSAFLYLIGLLGDSYYGLAIRVPVLGDILDAGFKMFDYTRNGFFYAPVFLALGAMAAEKKAETNKNVNMYGLIASMALMIAEGTIVHHFGLPRHDSMYIALLPCMYFMFRIRSARIGRPSPLVREISKWVYILHPLLIVALRGLAKMVNPDSILAGNNMVQFIFVCSYSILLSTVVARTRQRRRLSLF